jgi:hypothetical protein
MESQMKQTLLPLIFLITLFICYGQSSAESNFPRVNLTGGVTVELPINWSVMSNNRRITLETWKESVLEAHKLSDVENASPFAANYFDDSGNTAGSFNIRFYPKLEVAQSEAVEAGGSEFIKELDDGLRQNFTSGLEAAGGKMVEWLGTATKSINGSVYFISENRQLTPRGDRFHGILVRYLNAGKSFTIVVSYREDDAYILKPICNRIIMSIRH